MFNKLFCKYDKALCVGVMLCSRAVCQVGGQCGCKQHVEGRRCDVCRVGYFNLQAANPAGCEPCGCDVAGTVAGSEACHAALGECQCKQNVRSESAESSLLPLRCVLVDV